MIEIAEKQVVGPVIRLHPRDNVLIARTELAHRHQGALGEPHACAARCPPGTRSRRARSRPASRS